MNIYEHDRFTAGLPEDNQYDLNIAIPKMQARIRELERLVEALIVNQFSDPINTDNSHAVNCRTMLTQLAMRILKEKQ
jgi:hypothetical protein